MHRVFLALGTNLGEREQNLADAVDQLGKAVLVDQISPTYETEPWGVTDQPSFLNQVIVGRTMLDPHNLLVFIKRIEGEMGRDQEAIRWGPRLIDIDIVFYDDLEISSSDLAIPHPRLEGRAFVLAPLVDLDPDFVHPTLGVTVTELLEQCDLSTVTRVSEDVEIIDVEETVDSEAIEFIDVAETSDGEEAEILDVVETGDSEEIEVIDEVESDEGEQADLETDGMEIVSLAASNALANQMSVEELSIEELPLVEERPSSTPIPEPLPPKTRQPLPPIFWLMVILLALLVLVGVGFIGYYIILTQESGQTEDTGDIWNDLDPAAISPGLAIWTLTDVAPEQVYQQAMANDDIASATSMALTTPDLPNTQRLGWLRVLARRYASRSDRTTAGHLLELAADIAILEPELADYQRAEALVDVAQQWSDLDQDKQARNMLDNATLITQRSATITPPLRQQLLGGIATVYESIGDFEAARAIEALSSGGLPSATATKPADPLAPLDIELGYPEDLAQDIARRKAEAQVFVDTWIASEGRVSKGQILALEAVLIDEDIRRTAFYQKQLTDEALGIQQRALVLWDKAQWLTIKRRVADGLMGVSIVPNWEAERPAIRQALHDTFIELQQALTESITLMLSQQQPEANINLYRDVLIWARTGFYPDADQIFLGNALNDAIAQWPDASGLVPIAIIDDAGNVTFGLTLAGQ